jgi:hypothetical protein
MESPPVPHFSRIIAQRLCGPLPRIEPASFKGSRHLFGNSLHPKSLRAP